MTLSFFYHYNAWTVRVDPIAPKCQQSKPILLRSRLCYDISDIADMAFLFLGIHGKSGIFFNFGFITLVKRHGSLVEV